ncbi:MAG: hypothetical protein V3574_01825 [Candidatus Moraniibacteriota bacterium]
MRTLSFSLCIFSLLFLQACASRVYLEGQPNPNISHHIFYGKKCQINYSIGKFFEIDDEGEKLIWPDYIHRKSNPEIDPQKTLYLAFDGYIDNYHSQKISFFLSYQIEGEEKVISDEIWLFDTSLPTRKFLIKCPLILGTNVKCFLILRNEKMFDLGLPEISYRVSGKFDKNTNNEQIRNLIKEVNETDKQLVR